MRCGSGKNRLCICLSLLEYKQDIHWTGYYHMTNVNILYRITSASQAQICFWACERGTDSTPLQNLRLFHNIFLYIVRITLRGCFIINTLFHCIAIQYSTTTEYNIKSKSFDTKISGYMQVAASIASRGVRPSAFSPSASWAMSRTHRKWILPLVVLPNSHFCLVVMFPSLPFGATAE